MVIRVLHTPGHTSESISLLVTDLTSGNEPWMVLTGDSCLWATSAVRTSAAKRGTEQLYESLHDKLLTLPDHGEAYPAHISGSPCGWAMSGKPSSTISFERHFNSALQLDREHFVEELLRDLPPKPANFLEIIELNCG